MRYLAICVLTLACAQALAGVSYVVIAGKGRTPVSVSLDVPADYVAVSVYIRGTAKDPVARIEEVQNAKAKLFQAVSRNKLLEVQWVKSSFSTEEGSSFKIGSRYDADAESQLYVLGKVGGAHDVDEVTKEIIRAVSSVRAGDTKISTGNTALGIAKPEQHRSKLMALIQEELKRQRAAFGAVQAVEITGLEAPVIVTQKNDREVTLFLPYQFKLVTK
jgi:hypothetical protein